MGRVVYVPRRLVQIIPVVLGVTIMVSEPLREGITQRLKEG